MEVGEDNFDTYPSNDVCTHKSQTEENDYQCLDFLTNGSTHYVDHLLVKDHPSRINLNTKLFICIIWEQRLKI